MACIRPIHQRDFSANNKQKSHKCTVPMFMPCLTFTLYKYDAKIMYGNHSPDTQKYYCCLIWCSLLSLLYGNRERMNCLVSREKSHSGLALIRGHRGLNICYWEIQDEASEDNHLYGFISDPVAPAFTCLKDIGSWRIMSDPQPSWLEGVDGMNHLSSYFRSVNTEGEGNTVWNGTWLLSFLGVVFKRFKPG